MFGKEATFEVQQLQDDLQLGIQAGTHEDASDMLRIGRKQEFKRNFGSLSILGVTCVAMATWEALITASTFSLINGGLAGTIWVYLAVLLCFSTVVASLADLASMAPTTAGQYAWVSEFSPRSCQRFLSYVVGWLSVIGWQSGVAVTAYTSAGLILEMAAVNNPPYVPTLWHQTLATIAVVMVAFFCNTIGAKHLPLLEKIVLVVHIVGFLAFLIPLWAVAPKAPASEVFGSFRNFGGWSSIGAACVIGQLSATGSLAGPDSGAHLAEEVHNASLTVPRVMMTTVFLNGILGFIMIITYCFCITDIETMIVESTAPFPAIDVLNSALGSTAGATALASILAFMNASCCMTMLAAASRQAWSFGRDEGLPFSSWFRKITTLGIPVPVNAAIFSLSLSIIFSLLNLGSTTVFNSIVGLLSGSGAVSYFISIACVFTKRLRGEELPVGRWSLGKLAIAVNAFALCYLVIMIVISFFPLFAEVTVTTMNYSVVMFGGVTLLAILYYFVWGRRVYRGPVVHIRKE